MGLVEPVDILRMSPGTSVVEDGFSMVSFSQDMDVRKLTGNEKKIYAEAVISRRGYLVLVFGGEDGTYTRENLTFKIQRDFNLQGYKDVYVVVDELLKRGAIETTKDKTGGATWYRQVR